MKAARLATIRRLREAERNQRRAALADALTATRLLTQQLQQLDRERESWNLQTRNAAGGSVDVDRLAQANRYRWLLAAQRKQLEQNIERIQHEVEQRRAAVVEADRELKRVEKVMERLAAAERDEAARRTQRDLDEVAAQRWSRAENQR